MFTARYGLNPYITQIRFVFKWLKQQLYVAELVKFRWHFQMQRVSVDQRKTFPSISLNMANKYMTVTEVCWTKSRGPPIHGIIWGGAGKYLVWPTFRCHRTDWIVSLERRVCSCTELQTFYCYRGWKEACQATHAVSTTSRHNLSLRFLFSLQRKVPKEIHTILTETFREHAPSYATVKY